MKKLLLLSILIVIFASCKTTKVSLPEPNDYFYSKVIEDSSLFVFDSIYISNIAIEDTTIYWYKHRIYFNRLSKWWYKNIAYREEGNPYYFYYAFRGGNEESILSQKEKRYLIRQSKKHKPYVIDVKQLNKVNPNDSLACQVYFTQPLYSKDSSYCLLYAQINERLRHFVVFMFTKNQQGDWVKRCIDFNTEYY